MNVDYGASQISVELESGDLDLDLPDIDKTFNRLSLKIDRITDQDIRFAVWTSRNRGSLFDYKGDLVISAGTDEGKINFRATGSTFRFKLTSNSVADQYIINEIIIRGRPRGLEVQG